MPPKPRDLMSRFSGYADEASSYLRRRRLTRRPFARVHVPGGRITAFAAETCDGRGCAGRQLSRIDLRRRLNRPDGIQVGRQRLCEVIFIAGEAKAAAV